MPSCGRRAKVRVERILATNVLFIAQSLRPKPLLGEANSRSPYMKAPTVLCVDDDGRFRELYGVLLGLNGYQVIAASNCRHALHVFDAREKSIDAVILAMRCRA
jgi:PleD family two-component response regulator